MHLKYTFEMMELGDSIIAVPVGEDVNAYRGIIRLNETARFIFELLKNDTTEEALIDALEKKYDTSREELAVDVKKYVAAMVEKGIIIE